jgi:small-conductance mechanosensitive channel
MTIKFARWLAYIGGVLAPLGETVRRWSTWRDNPSALFDDYIIGALLIYGAWRVGRDARAGQRFLVAAWGFACGMGYASFFGQLYANSRGVTDPAPISGSSVAVVKGVAFAVAILALVASLRPLPEQASAPRS